jgi:hypothetical protein
VYRNSVHQHGYLHSSKKQQPPFTLYELAGQGTQKISAPDPDLAINSISGRLVWFVLFHECFVEFLLEHKV